MKLIQTNAFSLETSESIVVNLITETAQYTQAKVTQ
jgi:hypothetical protein